MNGIPAGYILHNGDWCHPSRVRAAVGAVQPQNAQLEARPLVGSQPRKKTRRNGVAANSAGLRVTLISFRCRLLDDDNLAGGFKQLRDAIAEWLGMNDNKIKWHYGQVQTSGEEGTVVKIEVSPSTPVRDNL